ncbi:MAG: hypothetical protein ACO1N1_25730 [Dyadobacter fermentans]
MSLVFEGRSNAPGFHAGNFFNERAGIINEMARCACERVDVR